MNVLKLFSVVKLTVVDKFSFCVCSAEPFSAELPDTHSRTTRLDLHQSPVKSDFFVTVMTS